MAKDFYNLTKVPTFRQIQMLASSGKKKLSKD